MHPGVRVSTASGDGGGVATSDSDQPCLLIPTSSDDGTVQYVTIQLADILEANHSNDDQDGDALAQLLAVMKPTDQVQFVLHPPGAGGQPSDVVVLPHSSTVISSQVDPEPVVARPCTADEDVAVSTKPKVP
jgi:hypothetical protein